MSSVGLAELVLIVQDVPASTRFYKEVVGLTLENDPSDDWAWFWAGHEGKRQRATLRSPLYRRADLQLPQPLLGVAGDPDLGQLNTGRNHEGENRQGAEQLRHSAPCQAMELRSWRRPVAGRRTGYRPG